MLTTQLTWAGRVVSVMAAMTYVPNAAMKLVGHPEVAKGMEHLGLPASMVFPLGIPELTCVAIYAIPQSAVIGAILLTGYIGGAILTHLSIGEAVYLHIAIGIIIWLGVWLREPRLRDLMPLRPAFQP